MTDRDPLEGLPPDLARVLRDQSVVVPQDGAVFALIAKWANAPSNTAGEMSVEKWREAWAAAMTRAEKAEDRAGALREALTAAEAQAEAAIRDVKKMRPVLDQLATCCNMLVTGIRDEDAMTMLAGGYLIEGIEFEVMRAAWLLGEKAEAERIHGLIGDHSPTACPVCAGDSAFGGTLGLTKADGQ